MHVATNANSRNNVAAVKVISKDHEDNTAEIIDGEVKVLQELTKHLRYSSSFVKLRTVYEDADNVYLVMDLCHGGSLADRMAQQYAFSESETRQVARQMLVALQELHALNLVHCDIKPENVMFLRPNSLDNLRVTDFGLSMAAYADTDCEVMGSPHYIAPEVLLRQVYSPSCDVWALGILVYKMLCGRVPFPTNEKIKENKLRFYDDVWATVSPEAKAFLVNCLVKDHKQRMSVPDLLKQPWLADFSDAKAQANLQKHIPAAAKAFSTPINTTRDLSDRLVPLTTVSFSPRNLKKQRSIEVRIPLIIAEDEASVSSDEDCDKWDSAPRTPASPMSALSLDSPTSSPDSTLSFVPPRSGGRHCARRQRKLSIDRRLSLMLLGRGLK